MSQIIFPTAKQYFQGMHPEYEFALNLEEKALKFWGYGPEQARALQGDMVAVACAHAKRLDAARGIYVVITDEPYLVPARVAA